MYFSKNKDINKLVLSLLQLGWSYAKGRHFKLYPPNGWGLVIVPSTPGDRRAYQSFRRDVRKRLCGQGERYRHACQELAP